MVEHRRLRWRSRSVRGDRSCGWMSLAPRSLAERLAVKPEEGLEQERKGLLCVSVGIITQEVNLRLASFSARKNGEARQPSLVGTGAPSSFACTISWPPVLSSCPGSYAHRLSARGQRNKLPNNELTIAYRTRARIVDATSMTQSRRRPQNVASAGRADEPIRGRAQG